MASEIPQIDMKGHCLLCYQPCTFALQTDNPCTQAEQTQPGDAQSEDDSRQLCNDFLTFITRQLKIPPVEVTNSSNGNTVPSTIGWEQFVHGSVCQDCEESVKPYCNMYLELQRVKMHLFQKMVEIEKSISLADFCSNIDAAKKEREVQLEEGGDTSEQIFSLIEKLRGEIRDGISRRRNEGPFVIVKRLGTPELEEMTCENNSSYECSQPGSSNSLTASDVTVTGSTPDAQKLKKEKKSPPQIFCCPYIGCVRKFYKAKDCTNHCKKHEKDNKEIYESRKPQVVENKADQHTQSITPTNSQKSCRNSEVNEDESLTTPDLTLSKTPVVRKKYVLCCNQRFLSPGSLITHRIAVHDATEVLQKPIELFSLPPKNFATEGATTMSTPLNVTPGECTTPVVPPLTATSSNNDNHREKTSQFSQNELPVSAKVPEMQAEKKLKTPDNTKNSSKSQCKLGTTCKTIKNGKSKSKPRAINKFRCNYANCGRLFKTMIQLQFHVKFHSSHRCSFCHNMFGSPSLLALHELKAHSVKKLQGSEYFRGGRIKCPRCVEQFSHVNQYRSHFFASHLGVNMTQFIFKCPRCNVVFLLKDSLTRHLNKSHGLAGKPNRISKMAPSGGSFQCNLCSAPAFSSLEIYQEHMRSEHDSNLVSCPECPRLFATQDKLNLHKRAIHGAADVQIEGSRAKRRLLMKVTVCALCPTYQAFAQGAYEKHLKIHAMQVVHRQSTECKICDMTFESENLLTMHMQTHNYYADEDIDNIATGPSSEPFEPEASESEALASTSSEPEATTKKIPSSSTTEQEELGKRKHPPVSGSEPATKRVNAANSDLRSAPEFEKTSEVQRERECVAGPLALHQPKSNEMPIATSTTPLMPVVEKTMSDADIPAPVDSRDTAILPGNTPTKQPKPNTTQLSKDSGVTVNQSEKSLNYNLQDGVPNKAIVIPTKKVATPPNTNLAPPKKDMTPAKQNSMSLENNHAASERENMPSSTSLQAPWIFDAVIKPEPEDKPRPPNSGKADGNVSTGKKLSEKNQNGRGTNRAGPNAKNSKGRSQQSNLRQCKDVEIIDLTED